MRDSRPISAEKHDDALTRGKLRSPQDQVPQPPERAAGHAELQDLSHLSLEIALGRERHDRFDRSN